MTRLAGWLRPDDAEGLLARKGDPGAAFALIAAILGFFAVLALALALAAGRLATQWQGGMAETATLQVFAAPEVIEEQARAALDVLKTTPGVLSVRMVDMAEQEKLLEPWLGPDIPVDSLPLPLMIEVATDRDSLDVAGLELRLAEEAPGAVYDDHAGWRRPLVATAERLRLAAWAGLGLLALALAAALGLAARTALVANGQLGETLWLVGAEDSFFAGALARRFARHTVRAVLAGTALALLLLGFLPRGSEQGFFLVGIGLSGWQWLAPLAVPAVAALIAWGVVHRAAVGGVRSRN